MKKTILSLTIVAVTALCSWAGTEEYGKQMKQTMVQPVQECWYGDTEMNVSLWGTYAFTGTSENAIGAPGFFFEDDIGDRYLQADHAWGGGIDFKYFWHKYFGFGVEGFGLDAKRTEFNFTGTPTPGGFTFDKTEDRRLVPGVLGTLTFRWPIGCSRFAPYVWAGGGGIFNGGEKDRIVPAGGGSSTTVHDDGTDKFMGQFGGGVEVRITRHIGWINDFSWNVVDGPRNNFGMARSGINFAF